jgi:hypothetical protein
VANIGYSFAKWSDNSFTATRADQNLKSHLSVSAEFNRNLTVALSGESPLKDTPVISIDFGTATANQTLTKTFDISNLSSTTMSGIKVEKSGADIAFWSIPALEKSSLAPGEKTSVTVSFSSATGGYKSAYLIVSATGTSFQTFRVPVSASVKAATLSSNSPANRSLSNSPKASISNVVQSGLPAPTTSASPSKNLSSTVPTDVWVTASIDGFFRHEFRRPAILKTIPVFWTSTDGLNWEESTPLSVRYLRKKQNFFEYEATLSPPSSQALIISVSETNPSFSKP